MHDRKEQKQDPAERAERSIHTNHWLSIFFIVHLDARFNFIAQHADESARNAEAVFFAPVGFGIDDLARRKEEYGYGIYENVITSVELENMFYNHSIKMANGNTPKRIGIIHCVGSRDEKVCNYHCSKLCCITGVKQAIELRELLPDTEIFCFYMDMRMFL